MKTAAEHYDEAMKAAAQERHDRGWSPQCHAPNRKYLIAALEAAVAEERARCAAVTRAEPCMPGDPPEAVVLAMRQAGLLESLRAVCRATKRNIADAIDRGDVPVRPDGTVV